MSFPSRFGNLHASLAKQRTSKLFQVVLWWLFVSLNHPLLFAQTASAPKDGAIVLSIAGKAEVKRAAENNWVPAQVEQKLAFGDRLRTGEDSRVTLRMADATVLRLPKNTTIEISPPGKPGQRSALNVELGSAYLNSRQSAREVMLKSRTAAGAIRGTELEFTVEANGRTVVTLLDGEVEMTNDLGQVVINGGEQVIVDPGKKPETRTFLDAATIIQWTFYYPAVVNLDELGLRADATPALQQSLRAYSEGDLLQALSTYPSGRAPASDPEKVYRATLLLGVGDVEPAQALLQNISGEPAAAVRKLIATAKGLPSPTGAASPQSASGLLADSYYHQSRSELDQALQAARAAANKAPDWGAAWARVAELEFGFGHTLEATKASDRALTLAPRQAEALALRGFLAAARQQNDEAEKYFQQAIDVDGALPNGWFGRGLMRIRRGAALEGRQDLQVAASLQPNRAIYRSYLGKAFSNAGDDRNAERELTLAKKLDPQDPTAWLYSALLLQQQNRLNEAIRDLEISKELNNNRSVYRSRQLLDQDQAVRSANLARIYQDVGMTELSAREASKGVASDYGNYSAHLFLANSYDSLRDPRQINLRYETAWLSEYLLANLLAPASGGALSPTISQGEYSRLFEGNRFGVVGVSEYLSRGDWVVGVSQYGVVGNSSYAVEGGYRSENGERGNQEQEQRTLVAQFKQELTPDDSIFLQVIYSKTEAGDLAPYFSEASANQKLEIEDRQEPILLAGYHHQWAPGVHTLFLAGRLDDTFLTSDPMQSTLFISDFGNFLNTNKFEYRSELEIYTGELQQIWQQEKHGLVVGARYQTGEFETHSEQTGPMLVPFLFPPNGVMADQDFDNDFRRYTVYAYENVRLLEPLLLTAGITYDRVEYPENFRNAPIVDNGESRDRFSPKVGLTWTPLRDTTVRGAYTKSLGGVSFDQSFRLEPTQVAGFSQAFRSLIPEAVIGAAAAPTFETWGFGVDQKFRTGTYLGVELELLKSEVKRSLGAYNADFAVVTAAPFALGEQLDYEERTIAVNAHQLIGDHWALGGRYRVTEAKLDDEFDQPLSLDFESRSTLQQANVFVLFHLPCGFFARADSIWYHQENDDNTGDLPGDDFWHFNVYAGYRFLHRRVETRVGVLNITDQHYRLNPLNASRELPHSRTLAASLRISF